MATGVGICTCVAELWMSAKPGSRNLVDVTQVHSNKQFSCRWSDDMPLSQ